jgi:hypothetical protein
MRTANGQQQIVARRMCVRERIRVILDAQPKMNHQAISN